MDEPTYSDRELYKSALATHSRALRLERENEYLMRQIAYLRRERDNKNKIIEEQRGIIEALELAVKRADEMTDNPHLKSVKKV